MAINRRDFILSSAAALAASSLPSLAARAEGAFLQKVRNSRARIVSQDASPLVAGAIDVSCTWKGEFCNARVVNKGKEPVRIREVVLFDVKHDFPPETHLYGESFQMLSQTAGTISQPVDLGYSEFKHYKIPQPADALALSGLVILSPPQEPGVLLGFTSCEKFMGRFYVRPGSIQGIIDAEGLELGPGQSWSLEELAVIETRSRPETLKVLAGRIRSHHPRRDFRPIPTGWCSWYCFGPRVTAQDILDNLDVIQKQIPGLKYIQIDDGYQAAMGDWLETGKAFGGDVVSVLKEIKKRGFEPAIWVAPFVAEQASHVFEQHPDWFIQGSNDKPLVSSEVTFGGWRRGPWYALDGTHPEVRQHFEKLFRTMREEWGCTYFKLDANFWGAMHGGRFHDPKATRIEAYRRGMEAIRRGAENSFILGCNHPVWPSFGLIDGSRSSGDIKRKWETFRTEARQTFYRNWQNGSLWWNDPDAVLLTGDLGEDEYRFHATAVYASGGMVLSGDDLTKIPEKRMAMLKKLLPATGIAAEFQDDAMNIGFVRLPDTLMICAFNWDDAPKTVSFRLPKASRITDYWTGEDLGRREGVFTIKDMPAHSARLLACK